MQQNWLLVISCRGLEILSHGTCTCFSFLISNMIECWFSDDKFAFSLQFLRNKLNVDETLDNPCYKMPVTIAKKGSTRTCFWIHFETILAASEQLKALSFTTLRCNKLLFTYLASRSLQFADDFSLPDFIGWCKLFISQFVFIYFFELTSNSRSFAVKTWQLEISLGVLDNCTAKLLVRPGASLLSIPGGINSSIQRVNRQKQRISSVFFQGTHQILMLFL